MTVTIILYIAIICQIYLLSYFFPQKIIDRINYVLSHYPASTHPKLYPSENSAEKATSRLKQFKLLTRSTIILGFALSLLAVFTKTKINDVMVFFFSMLQVLPFILLEISELKYYKMMRKENTSNKRTAVLKPRRYFNYISPLKFSVAVAALGIYIVFNFYRNDFNISLSGDGIITLVTLAIVHVYFAIIVFWLMRGKKINPLMEHKDRERHIGSVINTTYYTSVAMSVFLLVYGLIQHLGLDEWKPLLMSIYFQMIVFLGIGTMLKTNSIDKINFDVYRKDANAT